MLSDAPPHIVGLTLSNTSLTLFPSGCSDSERKSCLKHGENGKGCQNHNHSRGIGLKNSRIIVALLFLDAIESLERGTRACK